MKQDIIQEAVNIFDTPEKWEAFYEMEKERPKIINHWLALGAKELREEFRKSPGNWQCDIWGAERDTRWNLSDLGGGSINVGIGWETFEFHLFDLRNNDEIWQKTTGLLEEPDFRYLRERIGPRCYRATWQKEHLLLADLNFDPLETGADSGFRPRLIAWHAGQKTPSFFVKKTLAWIRGIIEDKEVVRLIRELNKRSSVGVKTD